MATVIYYGKTNWFLLKKFSLRLDPKTEENAGNQSHNKLFAQLFWNKYFK